MTQRWSRTQFEGILKIDRDPVVNKGVMAKKHASKAISFTEDGKSDTICTG